jgi:dihydrofolate reductase
VSVGYELMYVTVAHRCDTNADPQVTLDPVSKLRVHCLSMSVDGYVAGPNQTVDEPLGVRGEELHEWIFATRAWRRMVGEDPGEGEDSVDDELMEAGFDGIGPFIMGRNMFGPVRGDWGDDDWRGWWGDDPPYHDAVFVLTHHAHDPIEMEGGTTFHFVTDGIESALEQAVAAAGGKDIRLGGGASTVRQYLAAGLVDELHVAIAPVLLGSGEPLFDAGIPEGYEVVGLTPSVGATHLHIARRG